jgi:hypothetical protein
MVGCTSSKTILPVGAWIAAALTIGDAQAIMAPFTIAPCL